MSKLKQESIDICILCKNIAEKAKGFAKKEKNDNLQDLEFVKNVLSEADNFLNDSYLKK